MFLITRVGKGDLYSTRKARGLNRGVLSVTLFGIFLGAFQIALATSFEEDFNSGIKSYQAKEFHAAQKAFLSALENDPQNLATLINLGLTEFQLGNKPMAVGFLRKAQFLDPSFSGTEDSIKYILSQMDIKEIPHQILFWDTFRSEGLFYLSLNGLLSFLALTFLGAGWLLIKFIHKRKEASQNEHPLPSPSVVFVLMLFFLFLSVTLVSLKLVDGWTLRGTIVADEVSVRSSPDAHSAILFELYGGHEVDIIKEKDSWFQVTYPGALTGWVPKKTVLYYTQESFSNLSLSQSDHPESKLSSTDIMGGTTEEEKLTEKSVEKTTKNSAEKLSEKSAEKSER